MLIAEAIRRRQSECKLINLSSAAVYGNPKVLPVAEDAQLVPQSPYGWHKLLSEQICREYAEQFGVKTISLRIFSAYGEGQKKLLFWDTYQKVINTKDGTIEMFGTGNETRDFIYIGDVMQAMECVVNEASFNGQTINVASGLSTSIADAVNVFLKEAGMLHIQPNFLGNNKEGDPIYWQADIRKLEQLGFVQPVSLSLGLKRTIEWMQNKS
jgi:dTDP-glucose 4,6-dehydratase/UDP-glucose 4-epimerase